MCHCRSAGMGQLKEVGTLGQGFARAGFRRRFLDRAGQVPQTISQSNGWVRRSTLSQRNDGAIFSLDK